MYPINLNKTTKDIGEDYYMSADNFIFNKLKTNFIKNAYIILNDSSEAKKLISEYKNSWDDLNDLGLAVRELMEDVIPNMINSIDSFQYNLTFKNQKGKTLQHKLDITNEFKNRLEALKYDAYITKMNIRTALLDNIRKDINSTLLVYGNPGHLDLSGISKEIEDSYPVLDKSIEKPLLMKIIKIKKERVESHRSFTHLDIFKVKANEEILNVNSLINNIFNIDAEEKDIASNEKNIKNKYGS